MQCLAERTDYAKNPDKTNNGELIAAFQAKLTEQYGDAVVISVEENLI